MTKSNLDEPRTAASEPVRRPAIWFRVLLPGGSLGPGKIAMLRLIARTGSVSAAARAMRMSHARSVKLVAEINALGADPMIQTRTGGEAGGGAVLSAQAHRIVEDYDRLENAVVAAAAPHLDALATQLKR